MEGHHEQKDGFEDHKVRQMSSILSFLNVLRGGHSWLLLAHQLKCSTPSLQADCYFRLLQYQDKCVLARNKGVNSSFFLNLYMQPQKQSETRLGISASTPACQSWSKRPGHACMGNRHLIMIMIMIVIMVMVIHPPSGFN